jgi:hypothetical protein
LLAFLSFGSVASNLDDALGSVRYDGRTLFKGLMFFEGEISNHVELLKEMRQAARIDSLNRYQREAYDGHKEYTVAFIDKYYPGFFDSFGPMIQSGNPLIVDGALRRAGELILESWALKAMVLATRKEASDVLSKKTRDTMKNLGDSRSIEELRAKLRGLETGSNMGAQAIGSGIMLMDAKALHIQLNGMVTVANQIVTYMNDNLDSFIAINCNRNTGAVLAQQAALQSTRMNGSTRIDTLTIIET